MADGDVLVRRASRNISLSTSKVNNATASFDVKRKGGV